MIRKKKLTLFLFICATILSFQTFAQNELLRKNRVTPLVECVKKTMPSVVYLSAERLLPAENEKTPSATSGHKPEPTRAEYSLGSGCIVDKGGLVLTNAHVIHRARKILVTIDSGNRYWADVIASDTYNDLALLRIKGVAEELSPIAMAEPGDLLLGETVIIVGNPYGLGGTIVEGVLSAINRKVSYDNILVFDDLLQTDAAIHPGHSGAPLLNINGEVIGLSLANLQDAPGISFAIPQQRIADMLGAWLIPERFGDVSLGIVPAVKRAPDGDLLFYLQDVLPDSPAAKAGLYPGMYITHLNDKLLKHDIMEISGIIWKIVSGETVEIVGEAKTYSLTAEPMAEHNWRQLAQLKLGLSLRELTPELAEALGYPPEKTLVVTVPPPGNTSVKRGDILAQLGDVAINSPEDLARALSNIRYGQEIPASFFEHIPKSVPAEFKRKNTRLSINKNQ